ncbi:MAG: DNA polymerase I [Cyclobacteriaceae bacterium]|jgi:DNA polymerase-1|nr:DNA polymerase I [Cyclobacteriaceae bacterium]
MAEKTLFLLDAYALIFRAHFAFVKTPRINSKGINTSVPFGFTNTLLEVLQKQKPTHIGVAFDTPAATFRDEIFEAYKAHRQETPEDIKAGTPTVKEIIRAFNIPIIEKDGFEADDVIGTIAKRAASQGFTVYMMTPDKDFGQIVDDNIFLYKPAFAGNGVDILTKKEVCEKWDISDVSQVIEILGLQGDTADNIPGIPGFGPKTAAELIKQYGTIENIIAHSHELKGKKKELVETYGEQAILSKKLATIITDVPVDFDEEALRYTGPDEQKLKSIFDLLEFKTLTNRVFADAQNNSAPKSDAPAQLSMFGDAAAAVNKSSFDSSKVKYQSIKTVEEANALAQKLNDKKIITLAYTLDDTPCVAIACQPEEAYSITLDSSYSLLQPLVQVLANPAIRKISYNLKPFLLTLKQKGFALHGKIFDALLAHYLIEPEASHYLETQVSLYLGYELQSPTAPLEQRLCEQADVLLSLQPKLEQALRERKQERLMREIEMPLLEVLAEMENEGVNLDVPTLESMSKELSIESEKVQQEIFELAGTTFNIGSPKQLGEVLFDKLKLTDKAKKTKTGQYATGEEVLVTLADEFPIAKKILDFRELEKLRSTYVDALPKLISLVDGRIHTDYRQAVAATGRLSSNNPNLQNIPIRTPKGRAIRKAFIPRSSDYLILSADYSQIELRIAAAFAKDATMIEAFKNKRDIHATTAAKVFKVDLGKVTPDMRRKAKEVNFGILYGGTAFGLSQNLGISRTEASEIIEAYFKEFAGIKRYMDDSIKHARETEYVETILGRRRYLRDINSKNVTTRGFAERNAINAPIQGSAADIIKVAMINIQEWLKREKLQTKMIMQVHDELVFDVHKQEVDHVKEQVVRLMKYAIQLEVPMEVEAGVGNNWLEAH